MELIRSHIKYVFVLFQENRSFDFYFGSYPGADGILCRSGRAALILWVRWPGFTQ